ncbi:MFS transporter [Dactylosporangium vinaceum]|uniref:MFS transporter n=1 Tax=Dactylosporangium vinaceum TaxID=53362 RepID=A0ABV5M4C7_9ACTN|nr:MFS transporter [Dactylosporangium vinaceum]
MSSGISVEAPASTSARHSLVPLGVMFLFVGLSVAVVGPFLALFLSTEVRAAPALVGAFLVAGPLASMVSSSILGRLSDRRPLRRRLLLTAALAGCAGMTATAFIREYWILLVLTTTLTALSGSLFPQSFAYAREVLAQRGSTRAAMATSTLRMMFSIAWVAGPPIAALLLQAGGFRVLYLTAAAMYAIAAAVVLLRLEEVSPPAHVERPPARRAGPVVWCTLAAIAVMQAASTLNVQAMSLYLGHVLHAEVRDAGLTLGLCAALEIPLMLGFGALSARYPLHRLIVVGAALGVAYYALVSLATHSWQVAALQVLNASFIAAVHGLGISYVQELLPGEPGRAATLAANAFPVAALLSGPLLGLSAQLGYRYAYVCAAGLCLLGFLLLTGTAQRRTTNARATG